MANRKLSVLAIPDAKREQDIGIRLAVIWDALSVPARLRLLDIARGIALGEEIKESEATENKPA